MIFSSALCRKHPFRSALALLPAVLLCGLSTYGQGKEATGGGCVSEIPVGVKVIKLPDAEQRRVTISEFSLSTNKDAATYDLGMRVKNGTDSWCVTSLGLTYLLGDARGQQWLANEYPAVLEFRTQPPLPPGRAKAKTVSAASLPAHGVSLSPGEDEKRVVFDLYDYIQPRPSGFFDGFHLISAEIKYCMGYLLTKSQ